MPRDPFHLPRRRASVNDPVRRGGLGGVIRALGDDHGCPARHDVGVSDPNESRDIRSTDDDGLPESTPTPEIVEAEVVEDGEPARRTPSADAAVGGATSGNTAGSSSQPRDDDPRDDEQFRQYQQFLEFQKFQEWQRQQGGSAGTGPGASGTGRGAGTGRTSKRWWRYALLALRFRPVRWLLYLVLAFVLASLLIDHYFGSSEDSSSHTGTPGNQDPGLSPVISSAPKEAMIGLHNYLANQPEAACDLMNGSGQRQFAQGNNAPDCLSAVRDVHSRITNPAEFAIPKFEPNAIRQVPGDAAVSSCRITAEGGPKLGKFGLSQQKNGGWLIDSFRPETCP